MVVPAAVAAAPALGSALPRSVVPVNGTRDALDYILERYSGLVADRFVIVVNPEALAIVRSHCARDRVSHRAGSPGLAHRMLDAILVPARSGPPVRRSGHRITWCDQIAVSRARRPTGWPGHSTSRPRIWPCQRSRGENPYIHFERDGEGRILRVLQRREGDAMPAVGESDIGISFGLSGMAYRELLPRSRRNGARWDKHS